MLAGNLLVVAGNPGGAPQTYPPPPAQLPTPYYSHDGRLSNPHCPVGYGGYAANPQICDPCRVGAHQNCNAGMGASCWCPVCTGGTQRFSAPTAQSGQLPRTRRDFLQKRRNPRDEPPDVMSCPQCGGTGGVMGQLGQKTWYRCRDCGWEFSEEPRGHGRTKNPAHKFAVGQLVKRKWNAKWGAMPPFYAAGKVWEQISSADNSGRSKPGYRIHWYGQAQPDTSPWLQEELEAIKAMPKRLKNPVGRSVKGVGHSRSKERGWVSIAEAEKIFGKAAIAKAQARVKLFHGRPSEWVMVLEVPNGKKGVTNKLAMAMGEVPETVYKVPTNWDSSKGDHTYQHDHPKGRPPVMLVDLETNLAIQVPRDPRARITDWMYS